MTAVTSPLVAAYLADLERRLAGGPAADRLDVLDAVREHLDAAFADALSLDAPAPAAPPAPRTSAGAWVLLMFAGLSAGVLVGPIVLLLGLVHPVVLLGGLLTVVGVTVWVGRRAHGSRTPEERRPWQLAFAVVMPAALVAATWILGVGLFLPVQTTQPVETSVGTLVE
jgi:hypothetical protein